jgi:rhamnosyltransferase
MADFPTISVFIPVRNEAAKIRACLDGILSQTVPVTEILVADSGSTDGTLEILRDYPMVKIVQIPGAEFNHGETRNLGPKHTTGEFLLYTVGDARPVDNQWLERMLQPMLDDSAIMAVCGQQVVEHDPMNNPMEWFRPVSFPKLRTVQIDSAAAYQALLPDEKRALCHWDDVTVLYRRLALETNPFQRTLYCEDAIWARDALLKGWKLGVHPGAQVYHHHFEDADFTFKRTITVAYHRHMIFGTIPSRHAWLRASLRSAAIVLRTQNLPLSAKFRWIKHNWHNHRALAKAVDLFETTRKRGDVALAALHQKIAGKPPIPVKSNLLRIHD